jgi:hypothetical protein
MDAGAQIYARCRALLLLLLCRMDGSFARIQHANPWIALPYRYGPWMAFWIVVWIALG